MACASSFFFNSKMRCFFPGAAGRTRAKRLWERAVFCPGQRLPRQNGVRSKGGAHGFVAAHTWPTLIPYHFLEKHTVHLCKSKASWAALAATCLLAACGGSDSDTPLAPPVTRVQVVGDSLADSGTFGFKFTVQGSAPTGAGATPLWSDHVASRYGQSLCAHYRYKGTGSDFSTEPACTNRATGNGRINYFMAPTSPLSVARQLQDTAAAGYGAGDLVLVDGGGNDAADLIGAYLQASSDGGQAYAALLGTVLDAAAVNAALAAGAPGLAQVGAAYMDTLAAQFARTLLAQTVARGAPRVAVLNAPPITLTPRFRTALGAVAAAQGAPAAAQAEALFDGWVRTFNARLASALAGDARVVVVDFYSFFRSNLANPAQAQLSNTTSAACPVTGVDASGLPAYTLAACSASALSATAPPAGAPAGPDWWKQYVFADGFHPTPYVHQLMGQLVARSLTQAGWL